MSDSQQHGDSSGTQPSRDALNQHPAMFGGADLIEIYHARRLRDAIISQLRRLRASQGDLPLLMDARRAQVRGYYEALLLTVAELQQQLGDEPER